jgi:hypothetical protein
MRLGVLDAQRRQLWCDVDGYLPQEVAHDQRY